MAWPCMPPERQIPGRTGFSHHAAARLPLQLNRRDGGNHPATSALSRLSGHLREDLRTTGHRPRIQDHRFLTLVDLAKLPHRVRTRFF